jgi:hypothetical protein
MSEVREFLRHCPACGRRFHIKLVTKELTGERKSVEEVMAGRAGWAPGSPSQSVIVVEEKIPVIVDIRDFQYSYKCKHCGHEWSEIHAKETRE